MGLQNSRAAMRHDRSTREKILDILELSGDWCSGEAMSARLGISRAAVAKHIACLRAGGHAIEAVSRRGYRLLARIDALDAPVISAALKTRRMGKAAWHVLGEVSSTNLEAVRLATEGAEEGTVVLAETQTRGRGTKGHNWISIPRGLHLSVILRPGAANEVERMTELASLSVARAIKKATSLEAAYKVPNDVLVNGRKIAGILVETGFRGAEPDWAVVGIGCNVNGLPTDFPEADRDRFTSVLIEKGAFFSRAALLIAILESLEQNYFLMQAGKFLADP